MKKQLLMLCMFLFSAKTFSQIVNNELIYASQAVAQQVKQLSKLGYDIKAIMIKKDWEQLK